MEPDGALGARSGISGRREDMKLDAAYLNYVAKQTGLDPYNVEKVLRLKELLREFLRHPFLKGKLVLKGGTGINVFPRSVAG